MNRNEYAVISALRACVDKDLLPLVDRLELFLGGAYDSDSALESYIEVKVGQVWIHKNGNYRATVTELRNPEETYYIRVREVYPNGAVRSADNGYGKGYLPSMFRLEKDVL